MGFRTLRVINEDWVAPGEGFGTHPHRDMEIITYVLEGALEHKDSMGNQGVIAAGEVQRITAGTGITHSEFNHSRTEPVHLLQIWIFPQEKGLVPGYEQKKAGTTPGTLRVIASPKPPANAVKVNQDVELSIARLDGQQTVSIPLEPGRHAWVQVTRGAGSLNGIELEAGDGAAVSKEKALEFRSKDAAELLLFDLG